MNRKKLLAFLFVVLSLAATVGSACAASLISATEFAADNEIIVHFSTPIDKAEATDPEACNDCGLCVEACYFGARSTEGGRLAVYHERCHGCGLCVRACPEACVSMVPRRPGT